MADKTEKRGLGQCSILVVGAGVLGLWQALLFARAGCRVTLIDRSKRPFANAASAYAGAMIAPDCEAEEAPNIVKACGARSADLWRETLRAVEARGTLVVAAPRDQSELRRFARATDGHRAVDADALASLEPDLAGRFRNALYFENEAHMTTPTALAELLAHVKAAGCDVALGVSWPPAARDPDDQSFENTRATDLMGRPFDWTIDCRGIGARDAMHGLRGVRGERLVLRAPGVTLKRPVRLLHPRQPIYVVPWSEDRYLVGATVIESDDASPMTVRSALDLLGLAYALHPGFGEAEIVELTAGIRPSFADNVPRVIIDDAERVVHVNGAYRHGFLLAPAMAEMTVAALTTAAPDGALVQRAGLHSAASAHPTGMRVA
ncbi:MAG: FAD-dependent oxidoreductase [Pseudomonadota bacterium]